MPKVSSVYLIMLKITAVGGYYYFSFTSAALLFHGPISILRMFRLVQHLYAISFFYALKVCCFVWNYLGFERLHMF